MAESQPDAEVNEGTRLLIGQPPSPRTPSTPKTSSASPWFTILAAASIWLLLMASSHITLVPTTAILQDIICDKYYARVDLDPSVPVADKCSVEPVQSEMAYIIGWKSSLEFIPAIALAIPYGALADKKGRKLVLLLAVVGCFMNDLWTRLIYWFPDVFPIRALWLGGLWYVIGAGPASLSSLSFVLIADVAPPDQRSV